MQTQSLLYGLIGFFVGGLLVAVVASTDNHEATNTHTAKNSALTMDEMTKSLENKTGDDFDKAFIEHMIEHHEGAVAMAKLSDSRAKHDEIKQLSQAIVAAQEREITEMKQWQNEWGYGTSKHQDSMGHD